MQSPGSVPALRVPPSTVPATTEAVPLAGGCVMVTVTGRGLQFLSKLVALPTCLSSPDATDDVPLRCASGGGLADDGGGAGAAGACCCGAGGWLVGAAGWTGSGWDCGAAATGGNGFRSGATGAAGKA